MYLLGSTYICGQDTGQIFTTPTTIRKFLPYLLQFHEADLPQKDHNNI